MTRLAKDEEVVRVRKILDQGSKNSHYYNIRIQNINNTNYTSTKLICNNKLPLLKACFKVLYRTV